ncbi:hypothetical protein BRADI_1g51263v3 [Brachypodium distachyon]|uniref:Uncharacterized protein n=1 Tax=Brachypodium distachyon TaxID=15368 RepID=A0A2K2DQX6_BRADI|nr:hypothetical protein BRADI_1g51263v3 [Brachypodium distachyon]
MPFRSVAGLDRSNRSVTAELFQPGRQTKERKEREKEEYTSSRW